MAINLTPPTKMSFNISVILAVIALVLYFLNVLEVFTTPMHLAMWVAIGAWAMLAAGVAMKGV